MVLLEVPALAALRRIRVPFRVASAGLKIEALALRPMFFYGARTRIPYVGVAPQVLLAGTSVQQFSDGAVIRGCNLKEESVIYEQVDMSSVKFSTGVCTTLSLHAVYYCTVVCVYSV